MSRKRLWAFWAFWPTRLVIAAVCSPTSSSSDTDIGSLLISSTVVRVERGIFGARSACLENKLAISAVLPFSDCLLLEGMDRALDFSGLVLVLLVLLELFGF